MTHHDSVAADCCVLLLPGMSLNASIFSSLSVPGVEMDFCTTVFSEDGSLPHDQPGMESYIRELERRTAELPVWQRAQHRVVVGHSFGGMLAIEWLARQGPVASTVTGAVLIATTPGPMFDVVKLRLFRMGHHDARMGIKTLMALWNNPIVTRTIKRAMCGGSLRVEQVDFQLLSDRSDAAVDAAGWRNTDWRAMRSFRLAMRDYDTRQHLTSINIPIIVLHGSDDTLLPVVQGRALANALPNAELRVIPGAGHALPLTHGAVVSKAIAEVIART